MRRSLVGPLKMLVLGSAGFYACLIVYNIVVWLPTHYDEKPWPYFALENILFYFPGFFRGVQSQRDSFIPQLWEVLIGPLLVMSAGAFASLRLKQGLRFLGLDFVLLSSFSLMSFLVGLLANDIGRWFDPSVIESQSRILLRISLSATVGLLIALANSLPFYFVFKDSGDPWARCVLSYVCTILLPSAIVSLVTAGTPYVIVGMGRTEGQTLQWGVTWSPFHPRSELTVEGWELIFLPVISVATIATLSAVFAPALLNWNRTIGDEPPSSNE